MKEDRILLAGWLADWLTGWLVGNWWPTLIESAVLAALRVVWQVFLSVVGCIKGVIRSPGVVFRVTARGAFWFGAQETTVAISPPILMEICGSSASSADGGCLYHHPALFGRIQPRLRGLALRSIFSACPSSLAGPDASSYGGKMGRFCVHAGNSRPVIWIVTRKGGAGRSVRTPEAFFYWKEEVEVRGGLAWLCHQAGRHMQHGSQGQPVVPKQPRWQMSKRSREKQRKPEKTEKTATTEIQVKGGP